MKQFENPYLELILLRGDVITTSGTIDENLGGGENGGNEGGYKHD